MQRKLLLINITCMCIQLIMNIDSIANRTQYKISPYIFSPRQTRRSIIIFTKIDIGNVIQ